MMNISVRNKQLWMSNAVIVASLVAAAFFPTDGGFQSMISSIAFLVVLPMLFIRFFLKEKLSSFGVSWGDVTQGMLWMTLLLVMVAIGFFLAHRYIDMFSRVDVPLSVRSNFVSFLLYIMIAGVFLSIQEFFFRGFILNVWRGMTGYGSILIQGVLSLVPPLLRTHGVFGSDTLLVAVLSLCSGWLAFRSRSIWYSFFFFFISVILGISMVLVFAK